MGKVANCSLCNANKLGEIDQADNKFYCFKCWNQKKN